MTTTNPQTSTESINQILTVVSEIKQKFDEPQSIGDWISQQHLKKFLGYKSTTMRELEKSGVLHFSTIGRKKFIKKQDVIELLEKNIDK